MSKGNKSVGIVYERGRQSRAVASFQDTVRDKLIIRLRKELELARRVVEAARASANPDNYCETYEHYLWKCGDQQTRNTEYRCRVCTLSESIAAYDAGWKGGRASES